MFALLHQPATFAIVYDGGFLTRDSLISVVAASGADLREIHPVIWFVTLNRRDVPRLLRARCRRGRRRAPLTSLLALTLRQADEIVAIYTYSK